MKATISTVTAMSMGCLRSCTSRRIFVSQFAVRGVLWASMASGWTADLGERGRRRSTAGPAAGAAERSPTPVLLPCAPVNHCRTAFGQRSVQVSRLRQPGAQCEGCTAPHLDRSVNPIVEQARIPLVLRRRPPRHGPDDLAVFLGSRLYATRSGANRKTTTRIVEASSWPPGPRACGRRPTEQVTGLSTKHGDAGLQKRLGPARIGRSRPPPR